MRPRILLANDNPDTHASVQWSLSGHYDVQIVTNGEAALTAAQSSPPNLILLDGTALPRVEGLTLLRQLRVDARTATIPVILLASRADEEARARAMKDGADDYLVAPFSPGELMARVDAHLRMARLRREAEQRIIDILDSISDGFLAIDASWRYSYFNSAARRMFGEHGINAGELIGKHVFDSPFPGAHDTSALARAIRRAMAERIAAEVENYYEPWKCWHAVRVYPTREGGVALFSQDVTQRKISEHEIRRLNVETQARLDELNTLLEILPTGVWIANRDCSEIIGNRAAYRMLGLPYGINASLTNPQQELPNGMRVFVDGVEVPPQDAPMQRVARTAEPWHNFEHELLFSDGTRKSVYASIAPLYGDDGTVRKVIAAYADFTERKRAEEALRESEARLTCELQAMNRLHNLSTRLLTMSTLQEALEEVLNAAMTLLGADMGAIQLYNPRAKTLEIAAQRGLGEQYVEQFQTVAMDAETACAQTLRQGQRVVIDDVEMDINFASYREVAAAVGFRALQCTPLISRDGQLLGILSTYFPLPHRPSERELHILDLYARQATDFIERIRVDEKLRKSEERFRLATKAVNGIIYELDHITGIVERTCGTFEVLGYRADEIPASATWWHDQMHPDDRDRIMREAQAVLASDVLEFQFEYRIRHRSGRWVRLIDRSVVTRDGEGRAVRQIGCSLEIASEMETEPGARP